MLGLAAGCIASGVPLQQLHLVDCASHTREHSMQPTDGEHAAFYRSICSSLHGLKTLSFEGSSCSSLRTVNESVLCAPDLKHLTVDYMESRSARADPVHIQCKGLSYVRIYIIVFDQELKKVGYNIHFQLDNAEGLTVVSGMSGGGRA
jgi:hypothetical protein